MSAEIRMLLAVGLSVGIFYVWSNWFMPKPAPVSTKIVAEETSKNSETAATIEAVESSNSESAAVKQEMYPIATETLTTENVSITFTNDGGIPTSWELVDYQKEINREMKPVNIITSGDLHPLELHLEGLDALLPEFPRYKLERVDARTLKMFWSSKDLEIIQTYTLPQRGYEVAMNIEMRNLTNTPLQGRIGVNWQSVNPPKAKKGWFDFLRGPTDQWHPVYYIDGDVERIEETDSLSTPVSSSGSIAWGGMESRYFLAAIVPQEQSSQNSFTASTQPYSIGTLLDSKMVTAPILIPRGGSVHQGFTMFVGPKDIDLLKKTSESLSAAIDYGFFGVVAIPILYLLKFFYSVVHNYGIAIILLTVFIKLLLHPITKTSMKSMKRMQDLQPKLKELREKFKDDSQRLNMETMQLFKRAKVNPMGGCLPMLLQLPIYIALYRVLWNSIELYRAPFFGYITDLSSPDPYYITPLLLGVAFFFQQKLTPTPSADPIQRKMMMAMPLFFTAFLAFLPSGLVVYILVNTVFTVVQQWLMNRGLGFRDLMRGKLTPKNTAAVN